MLIDIPFERGLSNADVIWGNENECRFPLFDWLKPLPFKGMCLAYLLMALGNFY